MLIPILSSIVNVWEGRGFRYEAWQMANLNLSGLVALTLTIYNSYPFLNGTDNVVARLLALDYALVALATLIVLTLFRSRVGEKPTLSAHVAGEFYAYIFTGRDHNRGNHPPVEQVTGCSQLPRPGHGIIGYADRPLLPPAGLQPRLPDDRAGSPERPPGILSRPGRV